MHESARQEDQRPGSPAPLEGLEEPLQHLQHPAAPLEGLLIHLRRPGIDDDVGIQEAVAREAPHHVAADLPVAEDPDALRLVGAHPVRAVGRELARLHLSEERPHSVPAGHHRGGPPDVAGRGGEGDQVALTHRRLQEAADGGLRILRLARLEVEIVEDEAEPAAPGAGRSARTLVDTTVRPGGAAVGCSGSSIASNVASTWGAPSSVRAKSPRVRPPTGRPFESVTTTSTVTISTRAGNLGTSACCWGWAARAGVATTATSKHADRRAAHEKGAPFGPSEGGIVPHDDSDCSRGRPSHPPSSERRGGTESGRPGARS